MFKILFVLLIELDTYGIVSTHFNIHPRTIMNWAKRIKSRIKEIGMTQETLATKLGLTRGAITHYLAGRRVPPLKQFQKIAAILKVDPAWLQFGTAHHEPPKKSALKKEKSIPSHIPILTCEQIATYIDTTKIPKDKFTEYLKDFYTDKTKWYAVRVTGDAMTTPSGKKSFHEGDIIIVDPEKNMSHGNYVIALLPRAKEATFKQYVIDGGIRYLKPLNPQYPITQIDDSTHICGVLVGCIGCF